MEELKNIEKLIDDAKRLDGDITAKLIHMERYSTGIIPHQLSALYDAREKLAQVINDLIKAI